MVYSASNIDLWSKKIVKNIFKFKIYENFIKFISSKIETKHQDLTTKLSVFDGRYFSCDMADMAQSKY